MAEITGIYTASHTPVMLNFPDRIPTSLKDEIFAAYRAMGEDFMSGKPDALIVLSNDHLHNFFLDNFPAFCFGCADSYESPIEHWLHAKRRTFKGDQALGSYLLQSALQADFDPSFSMEMVLDHGSLTPLELAGVDPALPIVPILINCVQPPMPTMRRSYARRHRRDADLCHRFRPHRRQWLRGDPHVDGGDGHRRWRSLPADLLPGGRRLVHRHRHRPVRGLSP
jgi:aromatic ring-opening dioxygenase catalytic subunit (LigB family)